MLSENHAHLNLKNLVDVLNAKIDDCLAAVFLHPITLLAWQLLSLLFLLTQEDYVHHPSEHTYPSIFHTLNHIV